MPRGRWIQVLLLAAAALPVAAAGDFAEVERIAGELGRISGFRLERRIECGVISREELNKFLDERIKDVATPEEIRAEELTLKKFGLVPEDFDLARSTVDLLAEQAVAFYDYRKHKLFMTDSTGTAMREAALAHEIAHALADQRFNLERYIKQARKDDDAALARMAVMEGQATWLMSEWLAQRMGQSLATSPELAAVMSRSAESISGQYPVFDGMPLYMRETLLFPYGKGMQFQQAVYKKEGAAAFAQVFHDPPVSTQQVLHPEKYLAGIRPTCPEPPALRERGYKTLIEGGFGELDHAILLEQYAGKGAAHELAPQWRGSRYRLLENRSRGRAVLAYASEWATAEAARRFFAHYQDVLRKKWKTIEAAPAAEGVFAGRGDDGYFRVELAGSVVSSLQGAEGPLPPLR